MLLAEGLARGEVPAWLDIDALAVAYRRCSTAWRSVRLEAGTRYKPADAERQAGALIEPLLAAANAPRPDAPKALATPYAPPAGVD